jgi:pyrophosphatase PpaX
MKRYTYILFDWDGTIGKTLDIWSNALKDTLSKYGHSFDQTKIGADYELFRTRFRHLGQQTVDDIIEEALASSKRNIPSVELYEQSVEVLTMLHENNRKLGLVTTSVHNDIDPLLENFSMRQLFDVVVCGDDVIKQKPDAEPILAAVELLGAIKSATIMVGDSGKDIIASQNAGVDSILFYPPEHRNFHDIQYLKSLEPTYSVKELREIIDIVT